jgi:hypothetical protein
LGIALALSLAGNALVTHAYLGARDDAAVATTKAQGSELLAKSCSDGVLSLQAAADTRVKRAEAAVAGAAAVYRTAEGKAQGLLNKAPTVPGNACASAQAQIDDWLSARAVK